MMTKACSSALFLALLPGCPLLEVEVDVGEACITYEDVTVEPAPAGAPASTMFAVDDLSGLQELVALDAKIQLVRAQLRARSGIDDFAFVERVHVTLASGDPESTLPTLSAYDCEHCGAGTPLLDVPAITTADVATYVASGSLVIAVDVQGQLPEQAFAIDVDACVGGEATYTVEP